VLGTPGLFNAYRAGNVVICNAPGTGIADVVRDGENGLLVDGNDAPVLAAALLQILGNRAEAERLGAAARGTGEEWAATPSEYAARMRAVVDAVLH